MTAIIIFLLCASFSIPVIISVILFRDLRGHLETKISRVDQKTGELLLLIREMKEQLDIQKTHQEAMVRRIIEA